MARRTRRRRGELDATQPVEDQVDDPSPDPEPDPEPAPVQRTTARPGELDATRPAEDQVDDPDPDPGPAPVQTTDTELIDEQTRADIADDVDQRHPDVDVTADDIRGRLVTPEADRAGEIHAQHEPRVGVELDEDTQEEIRTAEEQRAREAVSRMTPGGPDVIARPGRHRRRDDPADAEDEGQTVGADEADGLVQDHLAEQHEIGGPRARETAPTHTHIEIESPIDAHEDTPALLDPDTFVGRAITRAQSPDHVTPHVHLTLDEDGGLEARREREEMLAEQAASGVDALRAGELPTRGETAAILFQAGATAGHATEIAGEGVERRSPTRGRGPQVGEEHLGDVPGTVAGGLIGGAGMAVSAPAQLPVTATLDIISQDETPTEAQGGTRAAARRMGEAHVEMAEEQPVSTAILFGAPVARAPRAGRRGFREGVRDPSPESPAFRTGEAVGARDLGQLRTTTARPVRIGRERVGTEGTGPLLDAAQVDRARGVRDPGRSRVRQELEQLSDRVRGRDHQILRRADDAPARQDAPVRSTEGRRDLPLEEQISEAGGVRRLRDRLDQEAAMAGEFLRGPDRGQVQVGRQRRQTRDDSPAEFRDFDRADLRQDALTQAQDVLRPAARRERAATRRSIDPTVDPVGRTRQDVAVFPRERPVHTGDPAPVRSQPTPTAPDAGLASAGLTSAPVGGPGALPLLETAQEPEVVVDDGFDRQIEDTAPVGMDLEDLDVGQTMLDEQVQEPTVTAMPTDREDLAVDDDVTVGTRTDVAPITDEAVDEAVDTVQRTDRTQRTRTRPREASRQPHPGDTPPPTPRTPGPRPRPRRTTWTPRTPSRTRRIPRPDFSLEGSAADTDGFEETFGADEWERPVADPDEAFDAFFGGGESGSGFLDEFADPFGGSNGGGILDGFTSPFEGSGGRDGAPPWRR